MMGQRCDGVPSNPDWTSWLVHAWNRPPVVRLVERYTHHPQEELY